MRPSALVLVSVLAGLGTPPAIAADTPCATPIRIGPESLPPGHFAPGVVYGPATVTATPLAYYDFTISQGVLPTGLALTGAYANQIAVSGTAVEAGTFVVTVTARNPLTGCSGGRTFAPTVYRCGDWAVDAEVGEVCDDGNTTGGDGCSANCLSDETCDNGVLDPGEECDGLDLAGHSCTDYGLAGELSCDPVTCTLDTSTCTTCGNGVIDPGEQCDGADLQGFDCASLGFGGGVLGCDPAMCTFDASGCWIGP